MRRHIAGDIGTTADQCRQGISRQGDLLIQLRNFKTCSRQSALGLTQFDIGIEPIRDTLLHQHARLFTQGQCGGGDITLLDQARQIEPGFGDIGSEDHACRGGIRACGRNLAERGIQRGAIATEEIQIQTDIQVGIINRIVFAGERWRQQAMFGKALIGGIDIAVDLQLARGVSNAGHRLRATHARLGQFQARTLRQGAIDQRIELRIAIGLPPAITRAVDDRPGCAGIARGQHGGFRRVVAEACAAGYQRKAQQHCPRGVTRQVVGRNEKGWRIIHTSSG